MVAALWQKFPTNLPSQVEACLDEALSGRPPASVEIYFRADDIAVPSIPLARLMSLFQDRCIPLALALVPAWLTAHRWEHLARWQHRTPGLWCWHQHGWRHHNHAPAGAKKAEFGPHRPPAILAGEIKKGLTRLQHILGTALDPIFTPPWNRLAPELLPALESIGIGALSRDAGQARKNPAPLAEFPVHVDLHTHKAADPWEAGQHLLSTLRAGLAGGRCGIMIHHQRMNAAAFDFLEFFLGTLSRHTALAPISIASPLKP